VVALTITLAALLALAQSGFDPSEGPHAWELSRRLLSSGELGSEAQLRGPSARGVDGRFYMSHDLGQALVLLPLAAAFEPAARHVAPVNTWDARQAAGLMSGGAALIFVVITCVGVYAAAGALGGVGNRSAVAAALLAGTTTVLVPYSRMAFDGVLAGAFMIWALAVALYGRRVEALRWVLLSGVLAGCALITRQTAVAMFIGLGMLVLARGDARSRATRAGAFVLGLLPFVIWQLYYNWLRTGSPWLPAVMLEQYDENNQVLFTGAGVGLAGLLASPGKSLFVYSPTLLMAVAGWCALWRDRRDLALVIGATVSPFILVHALVRNWAGEWGWGPRYMVTIVPVLMIATAPLLERWPTMKPGRRLAWMTCVATGAIFQVFAVGANWHYVYAAHAQAHTLDLHRAAWSLSSAQWVDAFGAVLRNVFHATSAPAAVDGVHPFVHAGAATFNTWWVILWVVGVERPLVMAGVIACVASSVAGAWYLARRTDPDRFS
jgi:4-amino-4-deoxy-L-arabinose transferase-like glycosyltransferase